MNRSEFYDVLADILELPPGSLSGQEKLNELEKWDSLALVSYIATCNGLFGVVLRPADVKLCASVPELCKLVASHLVD